MRILQRFSRDEAGATTSEYALLLFFIASGALAALSNLTDHVDAIFSLASDHLASLL